LASHKMRGHSPMPKSTTGSILIQKQINLYLQNKMTVRAHTLTAIQTAF